MVLGISTENYNNDQAKDLTRQSLSQTYSFSSLPYTYTYTHTPLHPSREFYFVDETEWN